MNRYKALSREWGSKTRKAEARASKSALRKPSKEDMEELDGECEPVYITTMNAIEIARKVVDEKQALRYRESRTSPGQYEIRDLDSRSGPDWTILDGFSASAIVAVYEGLNQTNRVTFAALSIAKMASVAFKLAK